MVDKHRKSKGEDVERTSAPVKDYPTPAPIADLIRKPLRVGSHLIILNNSGHYASIDLNYRFVPIAATAILL